MKLVSRPTILFAFFLLSVLSTACSGQIEKQNTPTNNLEDIVSDRKDYDLAYEFLLKLKNIKVDTIVFYKRTCINCCDFYNIFWTAKAHRYLTKFYFDFKDRKTHVKTTVLTTDKIFEVLGNNYIELKNTSIKENIHKHKDGKSTLYMIDHYCYTQLCIYIQQDSIITDIIKDHDFNKCTSFGFENSDKKETNDNYFENTNSKWNILLTTIEHEILNMPETGNRELETLRTKNKEK